MLKKSYKQVMSVLLAAMLVILAGCQSIAGVDLSKLVANNMTAVSGEGDMSLAVELVTAAGYKPSGEEAAILAIINSTKITIDNMKSEDSTHVSMTGKLTIKDKDIPFKLFSTDKSITIHMDGAKKPIVMPLETANGAISTELTKSLIGLDKKAEALLPTVVQYFVKQLPDVKIDSSKVSEKINGQSVPLTKLHIELSGSDLVKLLKGLLDNIIKDEAGLKGLIGQLFDIVVPILKENNDPSMAMILPFLDDKELALSMVLPVIMDSLKKMSASFDLNDPQVQQLKDSTLKLDLYVDSDSYIRKTAVDLNVVFPQVAGSSGIKGMKVTASNSMWNINKPVKAEPIDVSGGTLKINTGDPEQSVSFGKLMGNFDKNSTFYKLIKDDLKLLNKNVQIHVAKNTAESVIGQAYVNEEQYTMAPTRLLLEQLDADVKWNGEKHEITVVDYISDTTIVMHVGSNKATVNGAEKEMQSAVVSKDGYSYVPLRFIALEFGFDINYDANVVTVTRK
ncbi:copper amine oxidase N-terminal domain-containing protein [Paenibacillus albiflavus]|uniref:Copper amine oxidase N-terminal domain-containing protein n=1 Tax=Paenibacillus albiflavus TaxID=2545760 RepID=A0A4R4E8H6_9BACL|nr:copper amine oxidase N-terminal domain-containing protein [Paenibacillus albiflavus]TCZ75849.1 copper amine oxidase N-terminal domain-containing protein [Paenibacillus albiflavus]